MASTPSKWTRRADADSDLVDRLSELTTTRGVGNVVPQLLGVRSEHGERPAIEISQRHGTSITCACIGSWNQLRRPVAGQYGRGGYSGGSLLSTARSSPIR